MRALIFLTVLCVGVPASAQEAPTHRAELLAWSSDGATALVTEVITTPNGGGERAVRLVSKRGSKRIVLSRVADPSATTPQKISERSCISRLKSLDKLLQKRGFSGVTVDAVCADRATLIRVGDAQTAKTADTWFSGEGLRLSRDGLALSLEGNILMLDSHGATIGNWSPTPQPLKLRAAMSATGHLMLVFYEWGSGNLRIMKVLASKTGDPKALKSVRL
ncbi:MAG: hypothetical protein ACPGU1_04570 [Myxococcota bacterium]